LGLRQTKDMLLRKFLPLNWLRPENVLMTVGRSYPLQKLPFESPSLDVSCGDGLFSFITAGGSIEPAFDRFLYLNTKGYHEHKDIHENYDADKYSVPVTSPPVYRFTAGTDWKTSMIRKASELRFYDKLLLHDSNNIFDFKDELFMTIYSNSIYWVANSKGCIEEFKRMLVPGGKIYLQVITDAMLDFSFLQKLNCDGEWFHIIDRGCKATYKSMKTKKWWLELFKNTGLQVLEVIPTFSRLQANVRNIGLRPIAPYLIEMSNLIEKKHRDRIKSEYCNTMEKLIKPLVEVDPGDNPVDFLFVLTK